MTADDASDRFGASEQESIFAEREDGVFAATGVEAAAWSEHFAERFLINPDQGNQEGRDQPTWKHKPGLTW